ncbi:MAG: molybdopterin oxidoreductase [Bdellovibrionota bacterium]
MIANTGVFKAPHGLNVFFKISAVAGFVMFIVFTRLEPSRAWSSFVHNHFFFTSLAIGGLFFSAIQWLTGAMWSAPVRRLGESFTAYLPFTAVSVLVLYFGIHHLYDWSHAEHVKVDQVLAGKSSYLNVTFFMIRNIVIPVVWLLFARKMVGNSVAQDSNGDPIFTKKNRILSPPFLILFGLTFTVVSFDQIMSLDPHWFSTIFGVYCFSGLFYSTLALICLFTVYLKSKGRLDGIVNENHLHDLGKFMFAFTIFWAYIGFSQFMLIWYANLPEETGYFLTRFHGGWLYVSIFLLVGKFFVPFFLLLRRGAKRNASRLAIVAIFMLFAQWVDVLWLVQPEFSHAGPKLGLVELSVTLGFVGVFGLVVFRFLGKHNIVAVGDPRLAEAVSHHHQ